MYPQGACRIRKPAPAGNGCAIFPTFETVQSGKKIHCSAEADLFRGSQEKSIKNPHHVAVVRTSNLTSGQNAC